MITFYSKAVSGLPPRVYCQASRCPRELRQLKILSLRMTILKAPKPKELITFLKKESYGQNLVVLKLLDNICQQGAYQNSRLSQAWRCRPRIPEVTSKRIRS